MSAGRCIVCNHQDRDAIEEALITLPLSAVEQRFGIARSSLHRHKANHPAHNVVAVTAAPVLPTADPGSKLEKSIELVASLLALRHGSLPPTLNYEEPDPACPIPVAAGEDRPVTKPHFLKVGLTELGQCAAVVCRKWD